MTDPQRPPRGAVAVARLGRSHGLEGVVRVHPASDAAREALAAGSRVWIEGLGDARVEGFRPHGAQLLLRLDRVRRVERAKELANAAVFVRAEHLPETLVHAQHDDLDADLTGRPVRVDGRAWGDVIAVEGTSEVPIVRVRGTDGERLLPLAAAYVAVTTDGIEVTDPPPGLLDDA